MLNVVCVKWGNWCEPFTADYVNNLASGVRNHLTLQHNFICFADDAEGLDASIEVRPLPQNLTGWWWESLYPHRRLAPLRPLTSLPYLLQRRGDHRDGIEADGGTTRYPIDLRGWYNKLYLFKPGVLFGPTLFLDLDTVIVGNLDEIASYEGPFCILRDFFRPQRYGSGLMAFQPEAVGHLWTQFVRDGCPMMKRGDQQFIEKHFPDADFFPDIWPGQVVSYKLQCQKRGVPDYARIVCFHGLPRPHELGEGYVYEKWGGVTRGGC
jgi:hypothetical protein